ncbi:MAG: hypothetical protein FWC34_10560 [Bacteroidetes bacterium]|nr:hypothetical protein [Bacteroidota bacterium]MCL2302552.1 hypothetical protein [Lentimicrobiaceae bacterium]
MKILFKILGLTVCMLLLFATCKKDEPENYENSLFSRSYTDYVGSNTDSYVQVGDSIYYFNYIVGDYSSYRGRFNKNSFRLFLPDSLNYYQNNVWIGIDTEIIEPDVFFQKGTWKIDSIYIKNGPFAIGGSYYTEYYATHSVFTWDIVFYENRKFKGKGSLEIMETLYTDDLDTYYPPQKIEFEFK